jgi:ATP-dependent helicase/DNAse subunit B
MVTSKRKLREFHVTILPKRTQTEQESKHHLRMKSHDNLGINQEMVEQSNQEFDYAQVCVDDIHCLTKEPFDKNLEKLQAIFHQLNVNANATLLA